MRRALSFLTPFGGATAPSPAALFWFPPVGASIGGAVGVVWWLAAKAWAAPVAAALAVCADVAFTGYLHLDGLADAADGLLPPLDTKRRLEVMHDPAIGAFGAVTVIVVLIVRLAAFASARPAPLVVAGLWCASRTAMAAVARSVPYARAQGLASAFIDSTATRRSEEESPASARPDPSRAGGTRRMRWALAFSQLTGLGLAVALVFAERKVHGVVALVAELLATAAVVFFARRRIGGFTGDVLGAAGVIGETVGLLALASKW